MRRRQFLSALPLVAAPLAGARAAEAVYVLPPDDAGRLRVDFNANKSKVRLVFMLSPT